MANKTTAISVQVDTKDKEEATKVLQRLGVSMSGLINMTLKQVILKGGIPFNISDSRLAKDIPSNQDTKNTDKWDDLL